MNNPKPKISIIIPIYNVGKYLPQSLHSAVNQTLRDIEIVCVEDCSTDDSRQIVETFAKEDARIRCVFQPMNKGEGISRRDGIRAAEGEYILFLDGDDFLDTTACERLYREICQSGVDILQFGTNILCADTVTAQERENVKKLLEPWEETLTDGPGGGITDCCFLQRKFGFSIWNKIYRTDLVKTAAEYFAEERFNIAADLYLFFLISYFASSYKGVPEAYYNYNFGVGITGGKQTITDVGHRNKARQGLILRHLESFAREMDAEEKLAGALNSLRDMFASDSLWNWIWMGDGLDRPALLDQIFACFDSHTVVGWLAEYYYNHKPKRQVIIDGCQGAKALSGKKKDIKTIGTYYFRISNGGVERVMAQLMDIWVNMGYEVVLFTDQQPGEDEYRIPAGVKRVVLPGVGENNAQAFDKRIQALQQGLTQHSVDAMVYHAWVWEYLPLDMLTVKSLGIPFVAYTHSFLGQGLKSGQAADACHTLFLNTLYRLCDGVITLTEMDYAWLRARDIRVFKSINPMHLPLDSVSQAPLNTKNILWVGRISWEKRPVEALKILREVLDAGADAKLQILGKADHAAPEGEMLNALREMGLEEHVELLGFHRDVAPFYQNAAVYLCTSEYEGFLMTLAESKAFGVPAVLYDLPNLDMVRRGKGMKVVGQNCVRDAAAEIVTLLKDEPARLQLGREARESVEEMYAFDIPGLWRQVFDTISGKTEYSPAQVDLDSLKRAIDMTLSFTEKGIDLREEERVYWKNQYGYARRDYEWLAERSPAELVGGYSPERVISARESVRHMFRNGDIAFRYIVRYTFAWLGFKASKFRRLFGGKS